MTRLRTVSPHEAGWTRRRRGRGFTYMDGDRVLEDAERERCRALVIPPAWTDVWICPHENGHIQAVGTDAAGRRQYLYHPQWRSRRDREKFDFMLDFAARLPRARARVAQDLSAEVPDRERACALAFRMTDLGAFRIGSERYAQENGSHGLLTLERRHVRRCGTALLFNYRAKSGQERRLQIDDPMVLEAIGALRARRAPPTGRLLAYKLQNRWHDLTPELFSSYLKERLGQDASAKDFRTWQANTAAAAALALRRASSATARRRAVAEAMREVAEFLGNTAAVARSGYVDPRLVDLYLADECIAESVARRHRPVPGSPPSPHLERAVLRLLRD